MMLAVSRLVWIKKVIREKVMGQTRSNNNVRRFKTKEKGWR